MPPVLFTGLLNGESSIQVDRRTTALARTTVRKLEIPNLRMQELDVHIPLFLIPTIAPGVHLSGFLAQVYDAWMRRALLLGDAHFELAILNATALYRALLSHPWPDVTPFDFLTARNQTP